MAMPDPLDHSRNMKNDRAEKSKSEKAIEQKSEAKILWNTAMEDPLYDFHNLRVRRKKEERRIWTWTTPSMIVEKRNKKEDQVNTAT